MPTIVQVNKDGVEYEINGVGIEPDYITTGILRNRLIVLDNAINTARIIDKAVTADKLAEGAVTADKLAEGAVTADKLAEGAVTADKLAEGAVTADKIAEGAGGIPPDGVTIAKTESDTVNWYGVCYGGGKFVAVGHGSNAAYSEDGVNWTDSRMPSRGYWAAVTYGNGKFVAVNDATNQAAYSADGITWTKATLPISANWNSVCYGDGKFVAVGYTGWAAYSADGITWTNAAISHEYAWRSVCYGGGKFVAVASTGDNGGRAAYSVDGITWTDERINIVNEYNDIAYGRSHFISTGNERIALYYPEDAQPAWWTSARPGSVWRGICYGGDRFVLVGNHIITTDIVGSPWTNTALAGVWRSVCYGNGKFVAVAANNDSNSNSNAAYSEDGLTWTASILQSHVEKLEVKDGGITATKLAATLDLTDEVYTLSVKTPDVPES